MTFFTDVERELVLTARTEVAEGIVAFDFSSHNGRDLPEWEPGAHIDVTLAPGVERQYSLCGDPARRDTWRVAILRDNQGRGGSMAAHESLEVGARVRIRGPRNHFDFHPSADAPILLIAGGIGITPLRSMASAAEARGADWHLYYAGRTRGTMAFLSDLSEEFGDRVHVFADDEGPQMDLAKLATDAVPGTELYACGPAAMLDAVVEACAAWPTDKVHLERFVAQEFGEPVWQAPFEVELAATGLTVTVGPDQSILEAMEENGAVAVSSCRRGTCGTCEVPVIEGEIEHRDSILSAAEREMSHVMMLCVSRAACPRIVVDA